MAIHFLVIYREGEPEDKYLDIDEFDNVDDILSVMEEEFEGGTPLIRTEEYEGFPLDSDMTLEEVANIIVGMNELGDPYRAYTEEFLDYDVEECKKRYLGVYDSDEDWAQEDFLERYPAISEIMHLIDFKKYAWESQANGDLCLVEYDNKFYNFIP